jgi:hypothetical protein
VHNSLWKRGHDAGEPKPDLLEPHLNELNDPSMKRKYSPEHGLQDGSNGVTALVVGAKQAQFCQATPPYPSRQMLMREDVDNVYDHPAILSQ